MGRLALGGRSGERASQRPQRYVSQVGTIAYGVGNPLAIPQTDYLTGLDLIGAETVTTGATAPTGVSGAGAYSLYNNIQVGAPGGRAPFSMPGYHANELYKTHDHGYMDAYAADPLVVSSTNNWVNPLRVPLTVNPRSELGAFYTGDTTLNLTVGVTWNPVASVFGTVNSATLGGSLVVNREYFSAPQPDVQDGWLNQISYYVKRQLYVSQQLSNGVTPINLEVDADYVRILLIGYTGSLNAASFAPASNILQALTLRVNDKFNLWDNVSEAAVQFENLRAYQVELKAGSLCLDFARLEPMTRRDILPTDPNTAKRLVLNVTSNSSSNYCDVITEVVTDSQFAAQWIQSAAAKSKSAQTGTGG